MRIRVCQMVVGASVGLFLCGATWIHGDAKVREVELPSEYRLPEQLLEFVEVHGSLLKETIADVDRDRGHSLRLKELCVNRAQRQVSIGGRVFELEVVHVDRFELDDRAHKKYVVRSGSEIVYETLEDIYPSTVWAFYGNGDDWILETPERVVVSGVDLNGLEDCEKTFNYRVINGTPVYFVKNGERVRIKFGGRFLEAEFDAVLNHWCCDYHVLNPGCTGAKIMFYAYRDEKLYYVEVISKSA